jgi:ATP-dependent helicase/nuclease subunit A
MSGAHATLHPLAGNQRAAVAPGDSVWLSASAGTGKTQVLSARVLRLLLEPGVRPEQILCLTFTKAGATEMAARINETLARWVRADAGRLALELQAIGADIAPETLARARTLFAGVLDCPGGGLRIDTIHAFSQWLLAAFPEEAGLSAGARPMEEHEQRLLSRQVLGDLLVDAEARGDAGVLDALASLSLRMGADAVERYLMTCAEARELWFGAGSWQGPLAGRVRQLLGLASDADAASVAALCGDEAFDVPSLRCCFSAYNQWNGVKGQAGRAVIGDWLASGEAARLEGFDALFRVLFTQKDTVKDEKSLAKFEEFFGEAAEHVLGEMVQIRERRALVALAEWLAPALELGRAYALAWDAAKQREGLIDFDDQIRRAAELLCRSDMAEWIRYKLDRRFDHVLVDEAQDTNAAQWRIIDALTDDFFSGEGAHSGRARTLFVVGDYKQAIFGFQGTSPENFAQARQRVRERMAGAARNAAALRGGPQARELLELGLDRSFRTAAPVLDFVDRAIAHVGYAGFGLDVEPEEHVGEGRPGLVVLWRPVGLEDPDEEDDEPGASGEGGGEGDAETWLSAPEREMANRIAAQVKLWMDTGYPLLKGVKPGDPPRRANAGDVMVLVRKRRELAGLIVARLHAAGVPVAGVDRLRLGAPLAVRDLMAALRFAAQPLDDLNLAGLLVSPLIGWTQEQLLEHGARPPRAPLWSHLRRSRHGEVGAVLARLGELLAKADYEPVQALLHWVLVGPWAGRRRLVARLGRECGDPIDELLNAAHAFASTATPSLAGFIQWFEAGTSELKREAGGSAGQVRVMTVHGSKGLQAPIVILADATGNPDGGRGSSLAVPDPAGAIGAGEGHTPRMVPLPGLRKEDRLGPIAAAEARAAKAEREEHWRLLYVAMTRAEEALFVGGALGKREKVPAPQSWYARLAELFDTGDWVADPIWESSVAHGAPPPPHSWPAETVNLPLDAALPGWLGRPAPEEARPARPLVPSALGEDVSADPPLAGTGLAGAALANLARRGTLIHRLLERLPALADGRDEAARRWLARQAADLPEALREEIAGAALAVIADPRWAELFGPEALAEVPVAALVGTQVISGTIDRLLIGPERIRLVDFKTARRPAHTLAEVPAAILRQMAAYAAALEAAYPGRQVEAAVLYTQTPALIEIPPAIIAHHKQGLGATQQSLGLA